MKLREETCKDSCNKNRLYNFYSCDNCRVEYKKQKRQAETSKSEHYCTIKCYNLDASDLYIDLTCATCNIQFRRLKSKLNVAKHGIYFCSRKCKDLGQATIKEIQPPHYGTGTGISSYRQKALDTHGDFCNNCGYNDNLAAIVVHHIDRDRDNNEVTNLEVLCANCHAIEHWGIS